MGDKGNGLWVALKKEKDSDGIQEEVALLFSESSTIGTKESTVN